MGVYREKLFDYAPIVQRRYEKRGPEVMCPILMIDGWNRKYYEIEYLKPVADYLEKGDGVINNKRFFLITEEENVGEKAAFAILNLHLCFGVEQDSPVQNSRVVENNNHTITRLSSMMEYSFLLKGRESENEIMYFTGLQEGGSDIDREMKLRCIMSCQSAVQFVRLSEEQLETPWGRELLMNKECEIIYFPKCSYGYHWEVMNKLLEGERYRFDETLDPAQILHSIQKKCGNKFGEEDIAWSLDQAEKSARYRGDYRYFKQEDFKLDSYSGRSPLQMLNDMTGLDEMKLLAKEYAALNREQLRNDKLLDICKHAIFEGKPGTGKTMCGKLLAQIMSEQGQTNGIFVMASRKDIIGEYVGQTAPKIAGLFEKARKGVLFVDEAGFLLQESRNSFNQEAIKEFVRYMELYQDVMVIFALYPGEVEEFLKLDAGLCSRISRVVPFNDYSEQELFNITKGMCETKGYQLTEECEAMISSYMKERRRKMGDEFGNAREGRKLMEAAVLARSIRCYENDYTEEELRLTGEDFAYGMQRLYREPVRKVSAIGFVS